MNYLEKLSLILIGLIVLAVGCATNDTKPTLSRKEIYREVHACKRVGMQYTLVTRSDGKVLWVNCVPRDRS